MRKAKETLEKEETTKGKTIDFDWKENLGKGFRTVKVAGTRAFIQTPDEMKGRFIEPFLHLND